MFVFHQFRYRFYRFYQLILFHSVIGSRLDYIPPPPLIVKPTALEFNDSTPSYSRLLENSRLIPSEWSFRAFKICLWGNATRSFLALRRIIVMKSSKESPFCRCIPNLSKVAGLDPVFNLNLVQHQPIMLNEFSLFIFIKFANKNVRFATIILPEFADSAHFWYTDYANVFERLRAAWIPSILSSLPPSSTSNITVDNMVASFSFPSSDDD